MPTPLARGIIITVSVLVAASLAAYENPQVRAWIQRTRHKIAVGLNSVGDEVHPNQRRQHRSMDASMREEKGDIAEARRQRAVAEIMERGRLMEERRKRRKLSVEESPQSPNFDMLVDENGVLREKSQHGHPAEAATSAIEATEVPGSIRLRNGVHMPEPRIEETIEESQHSAVATIPARQLVESPRSRDESNNLFESRYEQEMREAWNIPLADRRIEIPSSHASDSLIELTPTTDAPDPDFSIPSAEYLHRPLERSDYFSAPASNSTHTLSDHEAPSFNPVQRVPTRPLTDPHHSASREATSTPSISGSMSDIHASEVEDNSDDLLSEIGDGIRTPGSVWTEVDSTISGDL